MSQAKAPRRTRGQRAGLSRARVLEEAVTLIDSDGLAELSMRKLGAAIGVEAMALYHYFPSKEALLDAVAERVLAQAVAAVPEATSWQALLRQYARLLRDTGLSHPAVLPLTLARPVENSAAMEVFERGLAALIRAGFRLTQARDMLDSLTIFVLGHTVAEVARSHRPSGTMTPTDAGAVGFPLLAHASRAGRGASALERFQFATEALIAGFETTLRR